MADGLLKVGARIALATCRELPDLDPDDRLALEPLWARGLAAVPEVWDDPDVDWTDIDAVIVRSTWDYARRREEFLVWAEAVPVLLNSAEVLRWNTDKRYLGEIAAPTVTTTYLEPGASWLVPTSGEYVAKPVVGAGSVDAMRLDVGADRAALIAHVERLWNQDRTVMLQPYLAEVDTYGETALIYFGGRYSHAIRKGPMLTEETPVGTGLFLPENITSREPSAAERATADEVLAGLPFDAGKLLYARVDLVPGPAGPVLLELELTEPSLFLGYSADAAERWADAIAARVGASSV